MYGEELSPEAQCPNCGSYKTQKEHKSSLGYGKRKQYVCMNCYNVFQSEYTPQQIRGFNESKAKEDWKDFFLDPEKWAEGSTDEEATEGGLGSGRKDHQPWMREITQLKTNKHKIPSENMTGSKFLKEMATENSMCGDCMDNFLIKASEYDGEWDQVGADLNDVGLAKMAAYAIPSGISCPRCGSSDLTRDFGGTYAGSPEDMVACNDCNKIFDYKRDFTNYPLGTDEGESKASEDFWDVDSSYGVKSKDELVHTRLLLDKMLESPVSEDAKQAYQLKLDDVKREEASLGGRQLGQTDADSDKYPYFEQADPYYKTEAKEKPTVWTEQDEDDPDYDPDADDGLKANEDALNPDATYSSKDDDYYGMDKEDKIMKGTSKAERELTRMGSDLAAVMGVEESKASEDDPDPNDPDFLGFINEEITPDLYNKVQTQHSQYTYDGFRDAEDEMDRERGDLDFDSLEAKATEEVCPKCKGRGAIGVSVFTGQDVPCPECNGTGEIGLPQSGGIDYDQESKASELQFDEDGNYVNQMKWKEEHPEEEAEELTPSYAPDYKGTSTEPLPNSVGDKIQEGYDSTWFRQEDRGAPLGMGGDDDDDRLTIIDEDDPNNDVIAAARKERWYQQNLDDEIGDQATFESKAKESSLRAKRNIASRLMKEYESLALRL